tara:strand:- start:70 stop:255 length:186 start_codon:yes stop_codon:yes gene_type:complete
LAFFENSSMRAARAFCMALAAASACLVSMGVGREPSIFRATEAADEERWSICSMAKRWPIS